MTPYRRHDEAAGAVEGVRPRWVVRDAPLKPALVLGDGNVAVRLVGRLLLSRDAELGAWRGVASSSAVLVMGDNLPWCEGARYLGRDPEAPGLYVPTSERLDVSWALVERAVERRGVRGLTALWPRADGGFQLASLVEARPVERALLLAWKAERGAHAPG